MGTLFASLVLFLAPSTQVAVRRYAVCPDVLITRNYQAIESADDEEDWSSSSSSSPSPEDPRK